MSTPTPSATATPLPTASPTPLPTATPTPSAGCPAAPGCPSAEDDVFVLQRGASTTLDVLDNDLEQGGEEIDEDTLTVLTLPEHDIDALFSVHDDHIHYSADPNYDGVDTFIYRVCNDDGLCDDARVTIYLGLPWSELSTLMLGYTFRTFARERRYFN